MPKGAPDLPDRPESAASLRERAALARRLMMGLTRETDRRALYDYAEELEAQAHEMERGGA
jgi:hypothetical protein